MRANFKRMIVLSLVGAAAIFVSGCNTVEGVGKDIKAGGAAIEDAAN